MGANNCCREGIRGYVLEREKVRLSGICETDIMDEKYILGMIMSGMNRILVAYVKWRSR